MNHSLASQQRRLRRLPAARVNHVLAHQLDKAARCGVDTSGSPVVYIGRTCKRCEALEARAQAVTSEVSA